MVGSGIASSLVHEVGHQAAALLDLVDSLRPELRRRTGDIWRLWERWISEIVADFWSVARVGVASTLGLMGVVSLPWAFVFRVNLDDPHPIPWIRVKLSCAMGEALYPHPQWDRLAQLWESFYRQDRLNKDRRELIAGLEAGMPEFVDLLVHHRPKALRGASLIEALTVEERQPARLTAYHQSWRTAPRAMYRASPTLGLRRHWPGQDRGKDEPRRGKHHSGKASHALGAAQHAGYFRDLRGDPDNAGGRASNLTLLFRRMLWQTQRGLVRKVGWRGVYQPMSRTMLLWR